MRIVLFLLLAGMVFTVFWATSANAQARPDTKKLTCEQAKNLVKQSGGIVLNTGPRIYERYVSDIRYCLHNEVLRRQWVQTKDTNSCQIGYSCAPRTRRNQ